MIALTMVDMKTMDPCTNSSSLACRDQRRRIRSRLPLSERIISSASRTSSRDFVAAPCQTNLTTTEFENLGSYGNIFDVNTTEEINLWRVDINAATNIYYRLYTKRNSFREDGGQYSIDAWTLLQEGETHSENQGAFTSITGFEKLLIPENSIQAFYITLDTPDLRYRNILAQDGLPDDADVGTPFVKNDDLEINVGVSVGSPTLGNTTNYFGRRVWSGALHYQTKHTCTSNSPSVRPSDSPTTEPSAKPSEEPTVRPTLTPSTEPSAQDSHFPSIKPSGGPTASTSNLPSEGPTITLSDAPSQRPTGRPSNNPSAEPTFHPSAEPTLHPSVELTFLPSVEPTLLPSAKPTFLPSVDPTTSLTKIIDVRYALQLTPPSELTENAVLDIVAEATSKVLGPLMENDDNVLQQYKDLNNVELKDVSVEPAAEDYKCSSDDTSLDCYNVDVIATFSYEQGLKTGKFRFDLLHVQDRLASSIDFATYVGEETTSTALTIEFGSTGDIQEMGEEQKKIFEAATLKLLQRDAKSGKMVILDVIITGQDLETVVDRRQLYERELLFSRAIKKVLKTNVEVVAEFQPPPPLDGLDLIVDKTMEVGQDKLKDEMENRDPYFATFEEAVFEVPSIAAAEAAESGGSGVDFLQLGFSLAAAGLIAYALYVHFKGGRRKEEEKESTKDWRTRFGEHPQQGERHLLG